MINWSYFPQSSQPPSVANKVVAVFQESLPQIDSAVHNLPSNKVLARMRAPLKKIGFSVEQSGNKVCFRITPKKSFVVDAWDATSGMILEIEAGRGVQNHQFLKDLFEACVIPGVRYLAIAVRNRYHNYSEDFKVVETFFDILYESNRLKLPLEGILVIGY